MAETHSIQTCRWGSPTLFLPWPYWCDGSDDLWSCTRGAQPQGVPDIRHCQSCAHWRPAPLPVHPDHHEDDHLGSTAS